MSISKMRNDCFEKYLFLFLFQKVKQRGEEWYLSLLQKYRSIVLLSHRIIFEINYPYVPNHDPILYREYSCI